MQRYIKIYGNVLPKEVCESMIKLFDKSEDQYEEHIDAHRNFKQINLIKHKDTWSAYNTLLSQVFLNALEQYKRDCKIEIPMMWPSQYGFEEFRMKRYEPNEGHIDLHTDASDFNTSKRFLAFFLYLNSGEDGFTDFPTLGITAPRIQGSMIMFPPLWTYPHEAQMPSKERKYIIGSYLHYLE